MQLVERPVCRTGFGEFDSRLGALFKDLYIGDLDMCLWVDEVPTNKRDGLIVKCWKKLRSRESYWGGGTKIETPFRGYPVSASGLIKGLLHPVKRGIYSGDEIGKHYVHGLEYKSSHWGRCSWGEKLYTAYAFQVVAYGYGKDLACRAMYIPGADKGKSRKKVIKINKLMMQEKLTVRTVIKELPELEGYLLV